MINGCPYEELQIDDCLTFKNKSEFNITYLFGMMSDNDSLSSNYPIGGLNRIEIDKLIKAKTIKPNDSTYNCFKRDLVYQLLDSCKDIYTFVKTEDLEKYSLEEIESRNLILKQYVFDTYEDMEAINFEMTYP